MKSDEMFQRFVAGLAGQATALYLQGKKELQENEQTSFEVSDELRQKVEDLEHNVRTLTAEVEQYKTWWIRSREVNRELRTERDLLLEKITLQEVEE